jgi:microcin C transport system substrate-binding protein
MKTAFSLVLSVLLASTAFAEEIPASVGQKTVHAWGLAGEPKYGPDFTNLDYVNVDAPKGGHVRLGIVGTFDSLNPYIITGSPASGLSLVNETLMDRAWDDLSADYALVAESMTFPDDHSWVEFTLNAKAQWHDGVPITPEDVVYSFDVIMEFGMPRYQFYYRNIVKAEKTGDRTVKFTFDQAGNRELPQIVSELPLLAKHYWEGRDFNKPTLDPPLGNGPYRIVEVKPGRSLTLERVPDYWAADLPLQKGQFNFDLISWEYYRDETVAIEALKSGEYDFRSENSAKAWATEYDFDARKNGDFLAENIAHSRPSPTQGFIFNTRRDIFADRRVRQALAYAFDFEWSNKSLFYGQYMRTDSYFENSELASSGLPSEEELVLLQPFRNQLPDEVFTQIYAPPTTDGSGNNRANLRKAVLLLRQAGWRVNDGVLVNSSTDEPFVFEVLLVQPSFERVVGPFIDNLKVLGIQATIRIVDPAQYEARMESKDFDMISGGWGQSISPGNEQRNYWGSGTKDSPGSRNFAGIDEPPIDALIDKIIYAPDRTSLITATHALDRILLNKHYIIPLYHNRSFRLGYWNRFGRPETMPAFHHGFPYTWWIDPEKDAKLQDAKGQ